MCSGSQNTVRAEAGCSGPVSGGNEVRVAGVVSPMNQTLLGTAI